jgi:hypothetical protein
MRGLCCHQELDTEHGGCCSCQRMATSSSNTRHCRQTVTVSQKPPPSSTLSTRVSESLEEADGGSDQHDRTGRGQVWAKATVLNEASVEQALTLLNENAGGGEWIGIGARSRDKLSADVVRCNGSNSAPRAYEGREVFSEAAWGIYRWPQTRTNQVSKNFKCDHLWMSSQFPSRT